MVVATLRAMLMIAEFVVLFLAGCVVWAMVKPPPADEEDIVAQSFHDDPPAENKP